MDSVVEDLYLETFPEVLMSKEEIEGFYTIDLSKIRARVDTYKRSFPGEVLFSVKANPLSRIIDTMCEKNIDGFDIASLDELYRTKSRKKNQTIYFMNPVKSSYDIQKAYESGVHNFALDSIEEYLKFREVLPSDDTRITTFIRASAENNNAMFELNEKFGISIADTTTLAITINENTKWKLGITFHTGSQTSSSSVLLEKMAEISSYMGNSPLPFKSLDIGGGFPGDYDNSKTYDIIRQLEAVKEIYDSILKSKNINLICEPGRGLVYDSMSLFVKIRLVKRKTIYLSDGIYGGLLACSQWLKYPCVAWKNEPTSSPIRTNLFHLYGPTCDNRDKLGFVYELDSNIANNDWLQFHNVGAYSNGLRTGFNGFKVNNFILMGS